MPHFAPLLPALLWLSTLAYAQNLDYFGVLHQDCLTEQAWETKTSAAWGQDGTQTVTVRMYHAAGAG